MAENKFLDTHGKEVTCWNHNGRDIPSIIAGNTSQYAGNIRWFLTRYNSPALQNNQPKDDHLGKSPKSKVSGRVVSSDKEESERDFQSPLAPLILLSRKEAPLSFQESITTIYQEEIDIFFESSVIYAEGIYESLSIPEKDYQLDFNEFLAIYFYTLEWTPKSLNLYSKLNRTLCASDRSQELLPWKHYLHYLINGLRKIPIWKAQQDVYRGVALNLVGLYGEKYKEGKTISWYSFSSTTTNLKKVQEFLGDQESTIFCINGCLSGRSIQKFSAHPNEAEILLPPGSRFQIISILRGKMTLIQMKQLPTWEKLLKLE